METVIVKWFRDVICNGLCIQPQVFDDFIKNNSEILSNFTNLVLSASQMPDYTIQDKVLIFYCLQQEEEIDVETESSYDEVEDEEEEVEGISLAESDSDEEIVTLKTGTPVSSYEEDLASTYISYATSTGQDFSEIDSSPHEEEESAEDEAPVEDSKKKIIKQLVMKTVLYASLNDFPRDAIEQSIMYFIALDNVKECISEELDLVNFFEFGVLNGEGLLSLQKVASLVYGPLIDRIKPLPLSQNSLTEDEYLLETTRFNVKNFIKYINAMPTSYPTCSDELYDIVKVDLTEDYDLKQWEEMIGGWNAKLTNTIDVLSKLNTTMDNFEELVSFWKKQLEETNYLSEQLQNEILKMTLDKIKFEGLIEVIEEYEKLTFEIEGMVEKQEQTVNILLLLKRTLDGCKVTEKYYDKAMIVAVENFQLIWSISREYNSIATFGYLFNVVNLHISHEALTHLDFKNIPKTPDQKILKNLAQGIEFLRCWKTALELSKNRSHSQSSTPDLTDIFPVLPTDHVMRVFQDLESFLKLAIDVIQISDDVNVVQGNEEKLMESRNELLQPIFDLEYDIFDLYYKDTWEKNFRKINNQLNNTKLGLGKLETVVPESEVNLDKSLLVVQRLRTDSLYGNETTGYIGLLNAFMNEVSYLQNLVQNQPIDYFSRKHLPDLTSYLYWLSSIINLIENGHKQLSLSKEVQNSPKWINVKSHTESVLSNLNAIKIERINQWQKQAENNLPKMFSQNLFIQFERDQVDTSILRESTLLKEVILSQNMFIQVNYPVQLKEIMFEARNVRNLGFPLSEPLQTVYLLESEVLCYENELRELLRKYSEMISYFPEEKAEVVLPIFKGIEHVIKVGCKNMTWCSISIPDYIKELNLAIDSTSVIVDKLRKVLLDLENSCSAFKTANLIQNKDDSKTFPIYKTLAERQLENKRVVDHLLKNYRSISYSLIKLENLIHKSETGCCKELKNFYHHWEEIILRELLQMVKTNLSNVLTLISSNKDVFQVKLVLKNKEIYFEPDLADILRSVLFTVVAIVKSTENFSRWLNGMCITVHEMSEENLDEISTLFSFFTDISQDQEIITMCNNIERALCVNLVSIEQSVKKLEMFKFLWVLDSTAKSQQFSKDASRSAYYKNFQFFTSLKNKLQDIESKQQFGCLTLSLESFLKETKLLINKWIKELGFVLYDELDVNISTLYAQLKEINKNLNTSGDSEDNLEIITETIKSVSGMIGKVDNAVKDYEEKYQVLSQFKIGVNKESLARLRKVSDLWQQILKFRSEISS